MIDFTRRRFIFGLAAAVPVIAVVPKVFLMPQWRPVYDVSPWNIGPVMGPGLPYILSPSRKVLIETADYFQGYLGWVGRVSPSAKLPPVASDYRMVNPTNPD